MHSIASYNTNSVPNEKRHFFMNERSQGETAQQDTIGSLNNLISSDYRIRPDVNRRNPTAGNLSNTTISDNIEVVISTFVERKNVERQNVET